MKRKILKTYLSLDLRTLPEDIFMISSDFYFDDIVVPKGMLTNGANIPRIFYSYIPPNKPSSQPAVVVHDFLCDYAAYLFNKDRDIKEAIINFNIADRVFKEKLDKIKIPKIYTFGYFLGVRFYSIFIRRIKMRIFNKLSKDILIYEKNIKILKNIENPFIRLREKYKFMYR